MISSENRIMLYKIFGILGIILSIIGIAILYEKSRIENKELFNSNTKFHFIIIFIGVCMSVFSSSKLSNRTGGGGTCTQCNLNYGKCVNNKCVCNPGLIGCTEFCYCKP